MRAEEVARTLGLSRSKIYQMMSGGALPTVRVGRAVRVPKAELRDWVAHPSRRTAHVAFTPVVDANCAAEVTTTWCPVTPTSVTSIELLLMAVRSTLRADGARLTSLFSHSHSPERRI